MDDVANCIGKVKAGDTHKNSIKNLHGAKKDVLAKTYAFLLNKKDDDEHVKKLTTDGLEIMIMFRLKQLMPDVCAKCNEEHLSTKEETPLVTCRMCGTGACKECFTIEEGMNKWFYLCKVCDEFVVQQRGEEALDKTHLNQKLKKKADGAKKPDEAAGKSDKEEDVIVLDKDDDKEEEEAEEEDEEEEGEGDGFERVQNKKRGFKKTKTPETRNSVIIEKKGKKEKKDIICSHFRKARCFYGMSGKMPYNGSPSCPYKHPRVCQRLLRHGDKGRAGCRGNSAGCQEFHPRMCFSSINTRTCHNMKECSNGYHMKGTTENRVKEPEKVPRENEKEQRMGKERFQEAFPPPANTSQLRSATEGDQFSSSFREILLQQKELISQMKQQQEQSRKQQEQSNLLQALLTSMMDQRSGSPMMAGPAPTSSLSLADCLRLRMGGSG